MKRSDIYGSGQWLKATKTGKIDLPGEPDTVVVKIKAVEHPKFDDGVRTRLVFEGGVPPWDFGSQNWEAIAEILNKDDDELWVGGVIEVMAVKDTSGMSKSGYRLIPRRTSRKPDVIGGSAAKSAPADMPEEEDDLPPSYSKVSAWNAWKETLSHMDSKDITALWKKTVAKRMSNEGKAEAEFTSDDWKWMQEQGEVPI
jgi:hypothetical protein